MSKIAWTDVTWSPIVGCSKVSPGCANCYAEVMARRLKAMGIAKYQEVVNEKGWTGKINCREDVLSDPLHWRKPRKVFVGSMTDMFHPNVNFRRLRQVFDVIAQCPQHTFQVLTKRPQGAITCFPDLGRCSVERYPDHVHIIDKNPWPLPNLWLGVTVENPDYYWRIEKLLQIPAAVRFVNLEPLLEPVNLRKWLPCLPGHDPYELNWVIIGCESGPKRRSCKLEWVRDIVQQCRAAGTACFIKQLEINGKVEHDMDKFPPDLQVRQFPETTRGRK